MDDELKIVIKAVLDDNAEKDLNSQLKSLNLEPISPTLKLDLDTSKSKKSASSEFYLGRTKILRQPYKIRQRHVIYYGYL